ncbi:MAG: hypothetical protein JXB48_16785 [Candidatus Latescibacteria bacterium]|nr:hypothetical protein [Candidatus Latescibacterota bacterium]
MDVQKLNDVLPDVYKSFLSPFFESAIPVESAATCSDCVMLKHHGTGYLEGNFFSKDAKCCTFHPMLSNYLIGAILTGNSPEYECGRKRLREKIKQKIGVLPHGIIPPPKYSLLRKHSQINSFGKTKQLVCPYYISREGACAVWPYSGSLCNTWFCKYAAGQEGKTFWTALKEYMEGVEKTLIHFVLHNTGFESHQIIRIESQDNPLTIEELDDLPPDKETYRSIWGEWGGREEELYRESYRLITELTPEKFDYIEGIAQKIQRENIIKAYKRMMEPQLPEKLMRNPFLRVSKTGDESYALVGYSSLDPLEVPKRIYDMIDYFDGIHSNDKICELIRDRMNIQPSEDLLITLYQFRILIENK